MVTKRLLCVRIVLSCLLIFLTQFAWSQSREVTGKVTDSRDGSPVAGASVIPKGSSKGTSTNSEGDFRLTVPANVNTLVITSVGFGRQEVAIGSGNVQVILTANNNSLNEVIVVGYGTQRKKELTGSIVKIDASKIANVPAPSFESALAGKAAGVQVITSSGMAGSGAIIRIRGISSISIPGDPLYVIDGLPIDATYLGGPTRNSLGQDRNPLGNLNPNDIESVEILKDAGAAGIYGSRGANGVVLITTKRGRGKMKINFSTRVGISTYAVKPKFVDKDTWLALRQEAWEFDGNTGLQQNLPGANGGFPLAQALANPGTDWWDLATRVGVSQDYSLSLSKGTKKFSTYVGATYSKTQSYIVGNDFNRIGIRANLDFKPIEELTLGVNGAFNAGISHLLNNAWNGGLGLAMSTGLPYYPVYNADGSFFKAQGPGITWDFGGGNNFLAQKANSDYRTNEQRYIVGATASFRPKMVKNLEIHGAVSREQNNSIFNSYKTAWILNRSAGRQGNGENNTNRYTNFNYNATASYILNLDSRSKFTFLVGTEFQEQETENQYVYVDSLMKPIYDGGKNTEYKDKKDTLPYNTFFQKLFRSYFARVNYSYLGRYILQASIRRDASSVFRGNNRFAYFPTVSASWIISDEDFMKNLGTVNFLKLRASWGLTGSSGIPWNAGYPSVNTARNPGDYYNGQPSIYYSNLGNPDLKWETSSNVDLALEFGILENRINGEIGVYRKQSRDILLEVPVPLYNGVGGSQWQNQGKILNEGIEFSINTTNVKTNDFTWTTNFNIAHNYNEVISIGTLLPDAIGGGTNETRIIPGYPVGTIYTVRFYGVDPADGLPIYLDKSGKTTKVLNVSSAGGDKVPVAAVAPDFVGGLTNTFRYKQFELNTLFTFQNGGSIWDNSGKRNMGFITDWQIYSHYVGNYWRKPGDIAKYPRPTLAGYPGVEANPWENNTSLQVYDNSFIRLKELTISYLVPENLLKRWRMNQAKFFITGYNVLLFTKYPIGDPEGGRDGENDAARNQSPNANFLNPPQQKSINFGINITF